MANSVIKLENVEKSYGKHKVLSGVNVEINKGDIFGLVGRNGSGKTTMFKVLLGLSKYENGKISIGDEGDTLKEGRAKTGFLIGSNFFPYLNARQNIEYYRVMKGIKDKKETDRVLKVVELDKAKGPYSRFSLGMKQRLGIANAILGNPEILILDEPTNGLDPQGIADVRTLVQKLNSEYGMTVIISSHILSELQNTAHRFGILNNGTVVRTITGEDLVSDRKAVKIKVDDLEKAKQALEAAGVEILGEAMESQTLEQFFFDVLGGEN
jgi:ABC-2 type transport system ATP-binding protein